MGPRHPFADQFPNRWAWRFEKDLGTLARTAQTAEGLQYWINRWPTLMARRPTPEMAAAWRTFVNRKLADLPWPARPEQVQAITTSRTRQAIPALGRSARAGRPAVATTAATPAAVAYRRETGERVQVIEAPPYLRRAGPQVETSRPVGQPLPGDPQIHVTERNRAPGGPVPPGWATEHVGRWHGRDTEVVYNPRRYQVLVTQVGSDIFDALEAQGWQRHGTDGDRVVWTRDRLAATRSALAHLDQAAAIGPPAPGPPAPELRPAIGLER